MNRERLQRTADLMREVAYRGPVPGAPKFNLENWHCGTTACAIGHAGVDPWHIEQGLHLYAGRHGTPVCGEDSSWGAVEKFYGITPFQACALFHPDHYSRPDQPLEVAHRIERFLRENT